MLIPFALALAAAATPAQSSAAPTASASMSPPPEFVQVAQAYGQCLGSAMSQFTASTTPEAGAHQAAAACAAQRAALTSGFETWVSGPTFPEAARAPARAQFKARIDGVEAQLADRIRAGRAVPTSPPPDAAPASPASPAPATR